MPLNPASALGGNERQHIARHDLPRRLAHHREEHLQVVRGRPHRIRTAPPGQELQVHIRQRHPDADIEPAPRASRPGHAQIISKHVTERVHRPLGGLRTAAIGDRLGQLVGGQPGASAAPLAAMTSSACSGVKRAPSGCIGTEDGRAGSAPVHIGRPAVGSGWMVPRGPGLSDGQSGHRRWLPAVVRR
jgi:hypothetical protein